MTSDGESEDETIRIDREAFLGAAPVISDRVRVTIDEIRKNRCFAEKGIPFDPKYAARAHDRGRYARGGVGKHKRGYNGGAQLPLAQRPPLKIVGDIPRERRCINENINKITQSNYATVSKRMKLVLDDETLKYGVGEILDKAYEQFDRCNLYVDLILDICASLTPAQRTAVQEFLREQLEESLEDHQAYPHVDPKRDYDGFCRVVKSKSRAVGRCGTFSKMLKRVQGFFGYTPDEYYEHHEKLVFRYVRDEFDIEVDVAASVETLLECLQVIVKHYAGMRSKFRRAVGGVPVDSFPSNKCKFKVLDILGK
jgi:hypothetical protein